MDLPLCWRPCLPSMDTWRKPHRYTQIFTNRQSPTCHSCFLFLLFPDLDHDLKPFLLPKLQVHIIKSCHLPMCHLNLLNVPRILYQPEQSGIHLELDRPKWTQDSKQFHGAHSMSVSALWLHLLAQHSLSWGQTGTKAIAFVLVYVPSYSLWWQPPRKPSLLAY